VNCTFLNLITLECDFELTFSLLAYHGGKKSFQNLRTLKLYFLNNGILDKVEK